MNILIRVLTFVLFNVLGSKGMAFLGVGATVQLIAGLAAGLFAAFAIGDRLASKRRKARLEPLSKASGSAEALIFQRKVSMNMHKVLSATVMAMALLALEGCAGFDPGDRLAEFKYAPGSPPDAIVIMSAGSNDRCVGNPQGIRVSMDGDRWHANIEAMFVANGIAEKSLFADHQGTLVVFHLPPGRHYVFPWPVNPTMKVVRVPRTDFSVAPGEVVYLGEVFIDSGCAWDNSVSYHDQLERDLAVLKARNPALAQAPIVKRILTNPRKADVF